MLPKSEILFIPRALAAFHPYPSYQPMELESACETLVNIQYKFFAQVFLESKTCRQGLNIWKTRKTLLLHEQGS